MKDNATSTEDAFVNIYNWLKEHPYDKLARLLTEPAINTYDTAAQWAIDYYINDENEGPEKAAEIQYQIAVADQSRLYYGNPDGYDTVTPTYFQVIRLAFEQSHSLKMSVTFEFTINQQTVKVVIAKIDTSSNAYCGTQVNDDLDDINAGQCLLGVTSTQRLFDELITEAIQ